MEQALIEIMFILALVGMPPIKKIATGQERHHQQVVQINSLHLAKIKVVLALMVNALVVNVLALVVPPKKKIIANQKDACVLMVNALAVNAMDLAVLNTK